MTPELIKAIQAWETASAEIRRCAGSYNGDTDDPVGIAAWDKAIAAVQRAERDIVSEALIAYGRETAS